MQLSKDPVFGLRVKPDSGRAIDAGITLDYSLTDRWRLGADLRILDGGADVEEVFNFARFNSAALAISTRF